MENPIDLGILGQVAKKPTKYTNLNYNLNTRIVASIISFSQVLSLAYWIKSRFGPILTFCITALTMSHSPELSAEPPTIVVTPSGYEQTLDRVGSSVSVVTKEELEEVKTYSLQDSLRLVPSLQFVQSGGQGRTSSVFLRGASSSQTLVLVDGIPVNEVNSGQFDFADLSSLGVDRVEVLKGSQSLMYGSDAIGGVINIITDDGNVREDHVEARIEAGSYGAQRYATAATKNINDQHRLSVNASWYDVHGISVANANRGNTEKDPYDAVNLVSSYLGTLPADVKVKASSRYTKARTELDTFDFVLGLVDAIDYRQTRETMQHSLSFKKDFEWFESQLILGYTKDSFSGSDPANPFNEYLFDSDALLVKQQNQFKICNDCVTVVGYSFEGNDGVNHGNFDETRNTNSLYAEQQLFLFAGNSISFGTRFDDDSSFGNETTYRVSMAQSIDPIYSKLHSSLSTGFRAPSFNDLYYPGFGNQNLNAEKSKSFDVGLSTKFDDFSSDISFFRISYDDLIQFNTSTFIPENIGNALTHGLETEVRYRPIDFLEGGLTYTYLDARDRLTDSLLPRRARHQGGGFLKVFPTEDLSVRTDLRYIVDRIDSDGTSMDNYLITNVVAEYFINENLSPYIRAENLFDIDYEDIPGYGTFGAGVYVGISAQM